MKEKRNKWQRGERRNPNAHTHKKSEFAGTYRGPQVVLDLVTNRAEAQAIHRAHVPEEHAPEHRVPHYLTGAGGGE